LIGLVYLENDLMSSAFTPERTQLLSLLSGQIAISIKNAELVEHLEEKVRERTAQLEVRTQFIEQTFGRYMSTEIAASLLKAPRGLSLGGEKKIVTIMMSDLRGFSALCETLPPETIVKVLNNYLSEMTTVIQKHNGTIHEFIGDGILAIFGAPLQRPDDADRAVACALEMQIVMDRVNAWNNQHSFPRLEMGIGINTGEVVAGTIGSDKRAKYSVVGSNVNLAVRIEGYTIGGQILISKATREAVKAPLGIDRSLTAEPKGVANPITMYEIESMGDNKAFTLLRPEIKWTNVEPPVPLTLQQVTGKDVAREKQDGLLVSMSTDQVEIQSQTLPPPLTDLKVALKLTDSADRVNAFYGKVIGPTSAQTSFLLRFTAISNDARFYLESLGC
jgi:class 3 adenylate cyclase